MKIEEFLLFTASVLKIFHIGYGFFYECGVSKVPRGPGILWKISGRRARVAWGLKKFGNEVGVM